MNVIDRIVGAVSPHTALQRAASRKLLENIEKRRFDAQARSRRTSDWFSIGTSANAENRYAIFDLRNRSRELVRNNTYASRAVAVLATNVVGSGITATPNIKNRRAEKSVKQVWKDWAESTECDFNGKLNFYGIQKLVMRSVVESGEVLVRIRRVPGRKIPIQLQVLESDFIDTSKEFPVLQNSDGMTVQGIEFDGHQRPVAYWIYPTHPGDTWRRNIMPDRILASEIIHVFRTERPGQVRGIPPGVSAMLRMRDFDKYEDAQLYRQMIAACFSVFRGNNAVSLAGIAGDSGHGKKAERLEPGMIYDLAPGETVTMASPPPTEGYREYAQNQLQAISAGFGVSYEALTNDYSKVNFSSARMGWIEFNRNVTDWQEQCLIPILCERTWKAFVQAASLAGLMRSDITASWTAPRRELIDPIKETKGMSEMVRNGFVSWSEQVRSLGQDPDEVLEQIKKDNEKFDQAGIVLECDPRMDPARAKKESEDLDASEGDEAENDDAETAAPSKNKK